MRADRLAGAQPVRALIAGYPGTRKTGSIVSLLNAGYKVRLIDYDGNFEPLLVYTKPTCLKNLDIVTLEDPIGDIGGMLGAKGLPQAFIRGFKLMDSWRYEDPEGEEEKEGKRFTNLGRSKDWGADTVVVLDGITGQADAAFLHAMAKMNKSPTSVSQPMWGFAMDEQAKFIKRATSALNGHHFIAISHVKLIGPQDIEKGDDDLTKTIKEQQAPFVPTKLFPSALGRALPQKVSGEFPIVLHARMRARNTKVRYLLDYEPNEDFDVKLPTAANLGELDPTGDGLLKVFRALGHADPGGC